MGIEVQPKFISFDMNGTLIHYRQDETVRKVLGDRLPAELADDFELAGEQIRFDECMGDWRPMHEVIEAALRRTMAKFGVEYREGDARAVYDQIPTWTPYPGVPEALRRLAEAYPLVILTNTDDVHAPSLVENLQAPFEVVITAEQAQAYKPRLRAFESHGGQASGVGPDEIVHVSSSPQTSTTTGRRSTSGSRTRSTSTAAGSPTSRGSSYTRINDIAELPALFGLARP